MYLFSEFQSRNSIIQRDPREVFTSFYRGAMKFIRSFVPSCGEFKGIKKEKEKEVKMKRGNRDIPREMAERACF